jgi:competence protein ComEA
MKGNFVRALVAATCLFGLSAIAFAGSVNVNTADAETLATTMSGVGVSKAEAIVEYRQANGPFTSLDQLSEVKGIGPKTVERNRAQLTVESGPAQ